MIWAGVKPALGVWWHPRGWSLSGWEEGEGEGDSGALSKGK